MNTSTQKVLIVDDEPRNQRIVAETLEGLVELETAASGEEALLIAERSCPDLIFLDIMMPGIDGYEVCRRIRANPRLGLCKVILVSGKAMIEERLKGYEAGADDYMTKPFASEELMAKAKVFLRLTLTERQLGELNRSLDEKVSEKTGQLLNAEAKLMNAAKMAALGEMAGGIAHEINTPLGTIKLVAEQLGQLVCEEPINRETIVDMTRTIDLTVDRISAIIQGLRTFSRHGAADRFESSPVKRIIENTLNLCREKLKHSEVRLVLDPIPDELTIHCQPVQISQVLLNLIANASDAIAPLNERWIRIAAERRGDSVRISVTDSGKGVPDEILGKLFEPFFTTKEIGKGTGLGLSISKGIIDAHHGILSVDQSCENTCFTLTLAGASAKKAVSA